MDAWRGALRAPTLLAAASAPSSLYDALATAKAESIVCTAKLVAVRHREPDGVPVLTLTDGLETIECTAWRQVCEELDGEDGAMRVGAKGTWALTQDTQGGWSANACVIDC